MLQFPLSLSVATRSSALLPLPHPPCRTPLPSLRNFSSSVFRTAATASPPTLLTTDSVEDAIEAACHALGRVPGPIETQLIETLHQNWFSSAADLASMTEQQAAALGVPLKLKLWIDEALLQNEKKVENTSSMSSPNSLGEGTAISARVAASLQQQQLLSVDAVEEKDSTAEDMSEEDYESSDESSSYDSLSSEDRATALTITPVGIAATADTFIEQQGWEALPIEQRICPPLHRFGYKSNARPRVVTRGKPTKYALKLTEMTESLRTELDALHTFGTKKFFGAQADPIADVTALKYQDHIRGMLGWMHSVRGVPIEALSLKTLIPTSERKAVGLAFEYCHWMVTERGVNVRTELLALRSILFAAKFIYHDESNVTLNSGDKPYSDLPVVKELRTLINTANKASKVAPRVADESAKWLDWPEYLALCQELKKECALLLPEPPQLESNVSEIKKERSRKQVAWSLQRYLMFAILACVPDRQRTLRELEVGRTLYKEGDRWIIRHGPKDYKTGRAYGERPPMVLNPTVYPELEAFVNTWRTELIDPSSEPKHTYLFTQANGEPFSDKQLSKYFMTSAYRITGQRLTPHLVRDSIVTFLRKGNATERELEALALYMGHSIEMQRSSYDRRTKEEKVGPAVALLELINRLNSEYK